MIYKIGFFYTFVHFVNGFMVPNIVLYQHYLTKCMKGLCHDTQ